MVKYIKLNEIDIHIDNNIFRFYCAPYFLRLQFNHSLTETYSIKYTQHLEITIKKLDCLIFKDLDLLTTLLPPTAIHQNNSINEITLDKSQDDEENQNDIDWHFIQKLPTESFTTKYGFNDLYQGSGDAINELCELDFQIEGSTKQSRRADRLKAEEARFDPDYYISDFIYHQDYSFCFDYKPWYYLLLKKIQKQQQEICFTLEENQQLTNLPNKNYLMEIEMENCIYLGLVDLLFGYCYNHRTTLGENTCESAWTIAKLSGLLSALETFTCLKDVVNCCLRRSLIFPLYRYLFFKQRSFKLFNRIISDVVKILKIGKRAVLKCLLEMQQLLKTHDQFYVLERIYLLDYCIWIQKASDKKLKSLGSELNHFEIDKNFSGFDLSALELMAENCETDQHENIGFKDESHEKSKDENHDKSKEENHGSIQDKFDLDNENLDFKKEKALLEPTNSELSTDFENKNKLIQIID
jgi:protein SHQ1